MADESSDWSSRRIPFIIAIVAVAALGAGYFLYVRNQSAYYSGRNLRILARAAEQINGALVGQQQFVRNYAVTGQPNGMAKSGDCGSPLPTDAAFVARAKASPGHELWQRTLIDRDGDLWLRIDYAGEVAAAPSIAAGTSPDTFQIAGTEDVQLRRGCGEVALTDIFDPVLRRELLGAFETVLIAEASGHVIYRTRPPQELSTLLRGRASDERSQNVPSLIVTDLSALQVRKGFRDYANLDPRTLSTSTRRSDVVVSDDRFILFSQPSGFALANDASRQWIVGGLVSAKRFRYEIAAISGTAIIFAVALAVLAICCWPFLRIALVHERQPLTISDVVLTGACAVIAAAVVTLVILDALAYRRISDDADAQLRAFAKKLTGDFARDVVRAATALKKIEETTHAEKNWSTPADEARILESVVAEKDVQNYPYFESFSWTDANGLQRFKASRRQPNPRVFVGDRAYFRDAQAKKTARASLRAGGVEWPYALEWVHSRTSNEVQAVLSKPTARDPTLPVIALAADMIDVSSAVPPPGVEFAIVDELGNVIYHSDEQRIGYENFFAECDHDRALRSAVLGRRESLVTANYWGDNTQLVVRPVANSPWTLIAYRSKRLVHAVNVEAVLMTALCLIINSLPYVILILLALIAAPWYRAPSLWPDPMRADDYSRLLGVYLLSAFAFTVSIFALTPRSLLPMLYLMPAQVILSTYLLLHRRDRRPRVAIALVLWVIATLLLLVLIALAGVDGDPELAVPVLPKALLIASLLLAAIVAVDFLVSRETRGFASLKDKASQLRLVTVLRQRLRYPMSYRLCGVLLLILGSSIPAVGFFKIGSRVESEMLVKYAQLRLAARMEDRINRVAEASLVPVDPVSRATHGDAVVALTRDLADYRFPDVFHPTWCLSPAPPPLPNEPRAACNDCGEPGQPLVPDWFAALIPQFSDDSVAMRQLYGSGSTDRLWKWCRVRRRTIKLDRELQLDDEAARKLYGHPQASEMIRITSVVPLLFPTIFTQPDVSKYVATPIAEAESDDEQSVIGDVAYNISCAILIVGVLGLFYWIVHFIASRIMLIDVAEPLWLARLPLSPTLGDHIFLTRRDRPADALTGRSPFGEGIVFYDISFETLIAADDAQRSEALQKIDVSPAGRNVRILDFEYNINDAATNLKKLEWLERLLALPDRTVIIVSAVSASYVATTPAPAGADAASYAGRWENLLDRFVWVTAEQLEMRRGESVRRTTEERDIRALRESSPRLGQWLQERFAFHRADRTWLEEETAYNPVLGRLRLELDAGADRKQLIDEIGERAETYYAALWDSCTIDEKLLLYQLAQNGLANGKNRRLLRRLIARALVRRDPNLELFSETFRLYVLNAGRADNLKAHAEALGSSWDTIRVPMLIVIVTFLMLLFGTQKDILTVSTTLMTALTSGIPLIIKLVGLVTERRLETAERA